MMMRDKNKSKLLLAAVTVTGCLLLVLGVVDLWTGPKRFDATWLLHPGSPVNWLTAFNLVAAGVAAGRLAWQNSRRAGNPDGVPRLIWPLLALVFTAAGFDEVFEIHEMIGDQIKLLRPGSALEAVPPHLLEGNMALALYAVGACGVFFLLLPQLKKDAYAYYSFCSAIGFQVTALLCERFFGWAEDAPMPWVLIAYLEESCELFGTLFYALAIIFLAINANRQASTATH